MSIAELATFTGVDPFPRLDMANRDSPIVLLPPTPHPGEKAGRKVSLATLSATAVERSALTGAQEPRHAFWSPASCRLFALFLPATE